MRISNKILTLLVIVLIIPFLIAAYTNLRGGFEIKSADGTIYYRLNETGQTEIASNETPTRRVRFPLADFRRVVAFTNTKVYPLFNDALGPIGWQAYQSYPYMVSNALSSAMVWPQYHPLDNAVTDNAKNFGTNAFNAYYGSRTSLSTAPWNRELISPVQVTFQVPYDYRTGGVFKMLAHQSYRNVLGVARRAGNTTGNRVEIQYRTYMTSLPAYWDSVAETHIPIAVGVAGYALSPTEVSLPITANENTIEGGKWITFQFARMRAPLSVDDLRILDVWFEYNSEY